MVESERLLIKSDPADIIFFDKIIESMDNLAVVTVLDGKKGMFEILVTSCCKQELLEVLEGMGKEYKIINE